MQMLYVLLKERILTRTFKFKKNEIKIPFDAITFMLDIIMIEKVAVFFKCLICAKEQKLNKIDVHT